MYSHVYKETAHSLDLKTSPISSKGKELQEIKHVPATLDKRMTWIFSFYLNLEQAKFCLLHTLMIELMEKTAILELSWRKGISNRTLLWDLINMEIKTSSPFYF